MYHIAILKNETQLDHLPWIEACNRKRDELSYEVIDITKDSWLRSVLEEDFDLFLLRPPGRIERYKKLYDERIYILSQILGKKTYPSPNEIYIYENKVLLRDWMLANYIPHPHSYVFYDKKEAFDFTNNIERFPLVAKTKMGASGNGVVFLNDKANVITYIKNAFSAGIKIKSGPKIFKGSLIKKVKKVFTNRRFIKQRLNDYKILGAEEQKGFVFFQEFIPHSFEWRCVRIGDSFFAHKKLAINNKSSGTLMKAYDPVPESLLNFVKDITDKSGLSSVSIDIFEKDQFYLVNEIQCFFGQSDPYQMLVNGKSGRYRIIDNKWTFEEGDFASDACYNLRIEHALSLLKR